MADPDSGRVEITRGDITSSLSAAADEVRPFSKESALTRELAAFLHFLAGGPAPLSSADEGVDVVRCVERLRDLAGLSGVESSTS